MSNQNKFNTKAIELTHDDLECIVGGRGSTSKTAFWRTLNDVNDALNIQIKSIGGSVKSASQ
jgi:hypothetical protein